MTSIGSDTDSRSLTVFNPFDLSPVDTVPENTPEDVEAALVLAHALFRDRDAWLPEYKRLAVLERTATLMEERFDQLSKIAVREGGKPMTDTRAEIARAIDTVKGAAAALRTERAIPMGLTAWPSRRNRSGSLLPLAHQSSIEPDAGHPRLRRDAFIVKPAPDTPLSYRLCRHPA